jgi:hypothetical protein
LLNAAEEVRAVKGFIALVAVALMLLAVCAAAAIA